MNEIIIDFLHDGQVNLEGKGFKGQACFKEMQFLKDALGVETSFTKKQEFYQAEVKRDGKVKAR
ncbi:MAG: DUF2997 domain-containing protein [Syntrophales bacterium]|nr:DUF2997 domain-containing protein [Syntrophales bacterium]MDD5642605.1 DUF2997 domain-containing protein [Syntrophales bacterium]